MSDPKAATKERMVAMEVLKNEVNKAIVNIQK
jgi:hypothetical protein